MYRSILKIKILILFVFFVSECQGVTKKASIENIFRSIERNQIKKDSTIKYIIATSGLNYRKKPSGEILGKLPLNTKVTIIERTGIFQEIIGEEKPIKGEWVGVLFRNLSKRVYVFDAFLSEKKYVKPLTIFDFQSYQVKNKNYGFVVLTDSYPWNNNKKIIKTEFLGNTPIKHHELKNRYRKNFLHSMKIKETDKVYIYNYKLDELKEFTVKELPLVAEPNPYGSDFPIEESDYLIGFDFKRKISADKTSLYYNSYVFIGEKNPFIRGGLVPVIWRKLIEKESPFVKLNKKSTYIFESKDSIEIYSFTNRNYKYYLKIKDKESMYTQAFHLIVKKGEDIVFDKEYTGSEGATPAPLAFGEKKERRYYEQWTGRLFKNKPPVIFGFMYYSFNCNGIDFLKSPSNSIWVKCDCRH